MKLQEAIDTVMDGDELRMMTRHNAAEFAAAMVTLVETAKRTLNPKLIDIVFDGSPGHLAGRFVEVEDQDGHGIKVGEWVERDDNSGYWVLRLPLGDRDDEPAI